MFFDGGIQKQIEHLLCVVSGFHDTLCSVVDDPEFLAKEFNVCFQLGCSFSLVTISRFLHPRDCRKPFSFEVAETFIGFLK